MVSHDVSALPVGEGPSERDAVPNYDEYKVMFSACDAFNQRMHGRTFRRWQQRYHEGRPAVLAHHINPRLEVLTEEHSLLWGTSCAVWIPSMSRRTTVKFANG